MHLWSVPGIAVRVAPDSRLVTRYTTFSYLYKMQAMLILIRVICYLDDAFPQGERLIEVLMVGHALEVQVVLVRVGILDEVTVIVCKAENDPSNGTVCLLLQVQQTSGMLLLPRQSPRLLLLQSFPSQLQ